ncbi:MAG: phosphatidylserine decarboxylase [Pseudomonadota bacterium]|jgi:phosphatidylserine decarboxylase
MKSSSLIQQLLSQESLNFWLTNRIPRVLFTRWMGKISHIRHPIFVRLALYLWKEFSPLDLTEAQSQSFESIHDCFVRQLKPGSRLFVEGEEVFCSPCDAIVGAKGKVCQGELLQAKGMVYSLSDLLQSEIDAQSCDGYEYVTLRLTSTMYHHFHAPSDLTLQHLRYVHGDVWNVNPPTLKRIQSLFAKNERAVLRATMHQSQQTFWMVPVAAVLVASMRFTFSDIHLHLGYQGPTEVNLLASLRKGERMGWFEHGSTLILLIPPGWTWCGPQPGETVLAGQALWLKT